MTIIRGLAHREGLYHTATSNAELLKVTLNSIGDAVIATDTGGRITFINPVGQDLTGWKENDAIGIPVETVFHVVNENTRAPVENPARQRNAYRHRGGSCQSHDSDHQAAQRDSDRR